MSLQPKKNSLPVPAPKRAEEIFYPESDGKPMGETDWHVKTITYLLQALNSHFASAEDVKIFADIMFYYEEGNPQKFIAPDVMVVKGVGKHLRRTFKLWEEKTPEVVFEISSRKTWGEDLNKKWALYQQFGVKEYYIFDPEYDYLPEPLVAYRLKKGELKQVPVKKGRIYSESLNLEIVDTGAGLRLFDPATKQFLKTAEELAAENTELKSEVERLKKLLQKK
jgi:Uma2 family endonuclease